LFTPLIWVHWQVAVGVCLGLVWVTTSAEATDLLAIKTLIKGWLEFLFFYHPWSSSSVTLDHE
jgi:hypothetical protein